MSREVPHHAGKGTVLFPALAAERNKADFIVMSVGDCGDVKLIAFANGVSTVRERPHVDWVNFCPRRKWCLLNTLLHEVLHILRVCLTSLARALQSHCLPHVVQKAREFFQCAAILGMPSNGSSVFGTYRSSETQRRRCDVRVCRESGRYWSLPVRSLPLLRYSLTASHAIPFAPIDSRRFF